MIQWRVMSRPRLRRTTSADSAVGDRPVGRKLSSTVDERIAQVPPAQADRALHYQLVSLAEREDPHVVGAGPKGRGARAGRRWDCASSGGCHFAAFKNSTTSASSCGESCWSRPPGMTETVLGRIASISSRGMRRSSLAAVAITISSAVSRRTTPLTRARPWSGPPPARSCGRSWRWEKDRLEQSRSARICADPRQVGPDLAAQVADRVAAEQDRLRCC